jgi:hypothetical protein
MSVFSLQSHPENVLAVFIAIKPIEGAPRPWADSHRGPPKFQGPWFKPCQARASLWVCSRLAERDHHQRYESS